MERPYATFYLSATVNMPIKGPMQLSVLAIVMFDLLVPICKKFTVELCMILILTFRMGPWAKVNWPHATFCVGISNVCPICKRFWGNHVWNSQCTWFKSLILKIKVKDVDDLDANLAAEYTLSMSKCILVHKFAFLDPATCSQYIIIHLMTDERMNGQTAC